MASAEEQPRPLVTLAALYGAAGTVIGPRVAEQLGVPYLDRAIPQAVAEWTGLAEDAIAGVDQEPRSGAERFFGRLGRASTPAMATEYVDRLDVPERSLRAYIEQALAEMRTSGGVALGRGGMVILREVPWALHVFLGGPRDARIEQRMRLEGIDRRTAERRQAIVDRTRIGYVRRAYGVDGEDPSLYHLVLDSTALDIDTCVELIVAATRARLRTPRPTPAI